MAFLMGMIIPHQSIGVKKMFQICYNNLNKSSRDRRISFLFLERAWPYPKRWHASQWSGPYAPQRSALRGPRFPSCSSGLNPPGIKALPFGDALDAASAAARSRSQEYGPLAQQVARRPVVGPICPTALRPAGTPVPLLLERTESARHQGPPLRGRP